MHIDESSLTARFHDSSSRGGDASPHSGRLEMTQRTVDSGTHRPFQMPSARFVSTSRKKASKIVFRPFQGGLVDPDKLPRYESLVEMIKKQKEKESKERELQRQKEREEAEMRLMGKSKSKSSKGGDSKSIGGGSRSHRSHDGATDRTPHSQTHRSASESTVSAGGLSRLAATSVTGLTTVGKIEDDPDILQLYEDEGDKDRAEQLFQELEREFGEAGRKFSMRGFLFSSPQKLSLISLLYHRQTKDRYNSLPF